MSKISNYFTEEERATTNMNNLKTSRFRRLALITLFLLLITALSVLLALYIKAKQSQKETTLPTKATSVRVCTSKQCLRSASDLAISMNNTVKPCDDFYQYVCGNWANVHPQLYSEFSNNWFLEKAIKVYAQVRDTLTKNATGQPKPVEQARDFYASCMDTGNIEEVGIRNVFEILKSINLPPVPTILNVSGDADSSTLNFDWLDTVIKIKTQLDMHILIGFDIRPLNTNENILYGFAGTTDVFPRSYNNIPKLSNNNRRSLPSLLEESIKKRLVENTIQNEEKNQNANVTDESQDQIANSNEYHLIKKYVMESGTSMKINETILNQNIIRFLKQYTVLNYNIELLLRREEKYDKWNVDDLQSYTDMKLILYGVTTQPIWKRYLEGIFNVSNVNLALEKDKVMVDRELLSRAVGIAVLIPPDALELYIWIKVVKALDRHLTTEKTLRSLQCSVAVTELLGMAVSYAIVEPDIFNVTKPKVLTMISEIKESLRGSVSKAEWMDKKTKNVSYDKITKINSFVGIPEWFYEPGKLEEYYEGVETSRDTYLKNMVNIVQARLRRYLNKFRNPNHFLWTFDPSEVNAAYNCRKNSITVPMVMLQHPFFDLGLDSLNYGNLGVVLGHEITHGFDNNGRMFDMNGNFVQWWSDDSIQGYEDLCRCFALQYNSYFVTEINIYVNGRQTLGENIADNGGLNQALAALKRHLQETEPEEKLPGFEHMSSEQMFFLSFAHVNGWQTLGENIADNGGLNQALGAMKRHLQENGPEEKLPGFEHLSSEQLFFLSFAHTFCGVPTEEYLSNMVHEDAHTPAEFRIRGTLENSEEFARAWNCPIGSSMNPDRKRCIIF